MHIPVCYGCPLRSTPAPTSDNPFKHKRCPISLAKSKAVKGMGFTTIDFKCSTKIALFQPGQAVRLYLKGYDLEGHQTRSWYTGWVMRWKDRKVQVISENAPVPILKLYPDRLTRVPANDRRVCIHCGKPEGVSVVIQPKYGDLEPHLWQCRVEYGDGTVDDVVLPCEYAEASK